MKDILRIGTSALLIAMAGAPLALAQSTEEAPAATETQPADEAPASGEQAPATDEEFPVADEGPQPGEGYLKAQHGAFEVRCLKAPEGEEDVCRMYHLLKDEEGASVAEFNLTALPAGGKAAAGVDIATPLGTLLPPGVRLQIDGGKVYRYNFTWCDQGACIARFGLTPEQVNAMKAGANAKITVHAVLAPEEPIVLNMPLKGFTAAWNEIAPK